MRVFDALNSTPRVAAAVALAAGISLSLAACGELTAPSIGEEPAPEKLQYPLAPVQSLFSLSPSNLQSLEDEAAVSGTGGPRWCSYESVWFEPGVDSCRGHRGQPPFGEVVVEDGDLRLSATSTQAAPFIWTGSPGRVNPFPEEGDFTVEVRMQVEHLKWLHMGLVLLQWDPAEPTGANDPFEGRVFQVFGRSRDGLNAGLPGHTLSISDPLAPHTYRLVYADGAYTLFVDGVEVAGPVVSDWRPNALWIGHPGFLTFSGNWTNIRVSQLTVSTPAAEVVEVPVDVKPGGCPSPISLKAKGVLPVAILGTDELDVTQIDVSTLRLGSAPPAPLRSALEDVGTPVLPYTGRTAENCTADGADGHMDLTVKFANEAVAAAIAEAGELAPGEEMTLTLTGNLLPEAGGTPIIGEDVVVIRGK